MLTIFQVVQQSEGDEKPKIMGDQDDIVVNLTWGNVKSETAEYVVVSHEKLGQPLARKNIIGKANKLNLHNGFECLSSEKSESMPSTKDDEISLSMKPLQTTVQIRIESSDLSFSFMQLRKLWQWAKKSTKYNLCFPFV